jgi:hypothetical protein
MRLQPNTGILLESLHGCAGKQLEATALLEVLEHVRATYDIKEILSDVIDEPLWMDVVLAHSYRHSNNFDKFVIDSLSEFGMKLRLHVWWDAADACVKSSIHNHPWDFASSLLIGSITMRRFEESTASKNTYTRMDCPTMARSDRPLMSVAQADVGLACIGSDYFDAGMLYCLSHTVVHSVAHRGITATLVLQGQHLTDTTAVYVESLHEIESPSAVRRFTREEALSKLCRLQGVLAKGG